MRRRRVDGIVANAVYGELLVKSTDPAVVANCGSNGYGCKDPSMLCPTSVPLTHLHLSAPSRGCRQHIPLTGEPTVVYPRRLFPAPS